jgi:hypothetical protein
MPKVDQRFRTRLWGRAAVLVAVVGLAGPLLFGAILGATIWLPLVGALIIASGVLILVPRILERLRRTEYVLTSRRAVVVDAREESLPRVIWAPLDVHKIKVKKRRSGTMDLDWGRSGGRTSDRSRPAKRVAQALGFVDRSEKEDVLFVEIEQPAALLGAIRSGRAALGLPAGFE